MIFSDVKGPINTGPCNPFPCSICVNYWKALLKQLRRHLPFPLLVSHIPQYSTFLPKKILIVPWQSVTRTKFSENKYRVQWVSWKNRPAAACIILQLCVHKGHSVHTPRATTKVTVYLVLPERDHPFQIVFLILKLNNPLIELFADGPPRTFQYWFWIFIMRKWWARTIRHASRTNR